MNYRIKKFSSGILQEYILGCRTKLDFINAVFTDNLLARFLEKDLTVTDKGFTRDIVSISFDMGAQSYEEAKQRIEKIIKNEENEEKSKSLHYILDNIEFNKAKFEKATKNELRYKWYNEGFDITYNDYKKNGEIKNQQTIHYVKLYRSTGQAKAGDCIFINEKLWDKANDFITMGIELPEHNAPIVEKCAYESLIASSIVDTIIINPHNVLVLKDYESFFKTNVVSIETNKLKQCTAKHLNDYELFNSVYDGQALLDVSIFPDWGRGYILLRNHMTKCAAFKCRIQQFFKDYFADKYDNAVIYDMWGNEHYVRDIRMITTESAMKWIKFDISYDYWCDKVNANHNQWGIVKTAHKSKLGNSQKMSYQMINCLDIDKMDEVTKRSRDYIYALKTDDNVFRNYLERNKNFANDFEVLLALVDHNLDFWKCDYFYQRRKSIIESYVKKFRCGKVIQEADNLVLVGNPYSMLLWSVGKDPNEEEIFEVESNCIQCYTPRFKDGEYLAGFRSPHNGRNNIVALHNIYNEVFDKYFDLSEQCIAVNCLHTPIQDRLNGADFDSDCIYTTNELCIVDHAKYCYVNYPTIVNNIPKEKNHYDNIANDYAKVDCGLASSQLAIGESSNLAQIALTYTYNFDDVKYDDAVCILSVIAQLAIDSAKRRFDVDIVNEIKRLKEELEIDKIGYPIFWRNIRKGFDENRIDNNLICPMNYLAELNLDRKEQIEANSLIPIQDLFIKHEFTGKNSVSRKVESLIEEYALNLYENINDEDDFHILLREDFNELVEKIRTIYISKNYVGLMSWLINRTFEMTPQAIRRHAGINKTIRNNKATLTKVLYESSPKTFLKCFKSAKICPIT